MIVLALAFGGLGLAVLGTGGVAAMGCNASRFGGCHANEDCKSDPDPDAGPDAHTHGVCFDFRCVECHYDGDCPDGKVCNRSISECMKLGDAPASSDSASSAIAPPTRTF